MKNMRINTGIFLLLYLSLLVSCSENKNGMDQNVQNTLSSEKKLSIVEKDNANVVVTVLASNIAYPRGLKFGPDGYLYVAMAGFGGPNSTTCVQVIPPVGPYKGGNTSKIIKISKSGTVSVVADHLPSSKNALGFTTGAADIEFIGNTLYALLVGGCSHGNADYPSSVLKINQQNGTFSVVADLSAYTHTHPVAAPEIDDFEPDGDPYSMINIGGVLYAIEPNHGEMVKVTTSGTVTRVIDFSAHYQHIVPTSVTHFDDDFYVGNLNTFPLVAGSSSIYEVSPDGEVEIFATGFTGILGVAFDKEHRLYVLETSAGGGPTPGTGRVVRINENKSRNVIVDKLNFPTGMTFGSDGALYISDTGFGPPTGKILKVAFNN